ncbi:hypothetical protein PMAYCL1PPCAC_07876, partial [Pristionchus mayeri]
SFTNFAKFGDPNGIDSSTTDLPARWIPVDKRTCGRNFVFNAKESHMEDELFEGRTAKYVEIMNKYHSI